MGKLTTNEFIERVKIIHKNKYDYSKVDYIYSDVKVIIICPEHGIFKQKPNDHLSGHGCSKCAHPSKRSTLNEFVEKANKIHNNIYDYSLVEYKNAHNKIKIICKKHGKFEQKPNAHLNGQGCPICKNSKGEEIITQFLKENNIYFEYQKTFSDCKNRFKLPFDFFLPNYNLLIEYNGEQHFKVFDHFGGKLKFERTTLNDKIKTEYALSKNYKLLRISYKEFNDLSKILQNHLNPMR